MYQSEYDSGLNIATSDNPFVDLTTFFLPDDIHDTFELARTIFFTNGLVNQAIRKLAEYAITDFEFSASDAEETGMSDENIEAKYEEFFNDKLNIKKLMIKIGLDYLVYGNAFISIYFPFERHLTCQECLKTVGDPDDLVTLRPSDISDLEYNGDHFRGTCPMCGTRGDFNARDVYQTEEEGVRILTWDPAQIHIEYFPYTGETIYKYQIPDNMKQQISSGDMEVIKRTPAPYLEAVREDKMVQLKARDMYHFKACGPTDINEEWGKSLIISVFKHIFYSTILRKGAQAIAMDHIQPLRVIFPQLTGKEGFAAMDIPMGVFSKMIDNEFSRWRRDKNRLMKSPIPVGMQFLGGQGRTLLPTPEIQQATQEIFLALGLPQGLLLGEARWASNSIAMRIVENHFLTYREDIQNVLDFIKQRVRDYLDYPDCEVKMREFKMIDNVQYQQTLIQLAQLGFISKQTALSPYDFEWEEEQKDRLQEMINEADVQAQAQSHMMKIQNEKQKEIMDMQQSAMFEQYLDQLEQSTESFISQVQRYKSAGFGLDQAIQMVTAQQQQMAMMQQMMQQQQMAQQARAMFMQERMSSSAWSLARAQKQLQMFDMMNSINPPPQMGGGNTAPEYVNSLVSHLLQLDPETRDQQLQNIEQRDQVLYERVVNYLNNLGALPGQPQKPQSNVMPLPTDGTPSEERR